MKLTHSHVDIVVRDLDAAVDYPRTALGLTAGPVRHWQRDGFHVRYQAVSNRWQQFILVQPISGDLVDLLDRKGEGTIYRLCLATPDLADAHRHLLAARRAARR